MRTLIIALLLPLLSIGQDSFTYDQDGLNPKDLVVQVNGINQNGLYEKTLAWIKDSYQDPDEVIKATTENQKIRIEGYQDNLICVSALGSTTCYGASYNIEVSFKDGRYKFEPISINYRLPPSQYSSGMNVQVDFTDGSGYYNKKGKLRKATESVPTSISDLSNTLNASLLKHMTSKEEEW